MGTAKSRTKNTEVESYPCPISQHLRAYLRTHPDISSSKKIVQIIPLMFSQGRGCVSLEGSVFKFADASVSSRDGGGGGEEELEGQTGGKGTLIAA
jgi:hypothetical protein